MFGMYGFAPWCLAEKMYRAVEKETAKNFKSLFFSAHLHAKERTLFFFLASERAGILNPRI